ncbi:MAG: BMP family ABC transporter substrate-binding protein [Alphaproteobacteria bacterium]|nr:BMP family ABC transporter substrate-binding protein [Alphaproteobacteria bacterium]
MYKRFLAALLVMFQALVFAPAAFAAPANKALNAAIVFNRNVQGIDDKSFIAAVKSGAERAKEELRIPLKIYSQNSSESDREFLSAVAEDNNDIIIGMSFSDTAPLLDMAEKYPNVKFMVIDGVLPPFYINAKSIIFREHEGSFLVGMLAALKSKTNKIGFIGGRDLPLIRNFGHGYSQGAKYINPDIQINEEYIGNSFEAWDQPDQAEAMANALFDAEVDIIFAAAGASGLGVLKAASQREDAYAIGVDSNQNYLYPGHVLTSMVKRIDNAIYEALKDAKNGKWEPGILNLGLKEKGLDYSIDQHNKHLFTAQHIETVEQARSKIIDGTLIVKMYSSVNNH